MTVRFTPLALFLLALTACDTQGNAIVGGALTYAEQSVTGQIGLIKRANVDAVEAWRVAACALPIGGLAGTGDATAVKAVLTACPVPGVGQVTVSETGAVSISMGAPSIALPVTPPPAAASVPARAPARAPAVSASPVSAVPPRIRRPAVTQAVLTQSIVPPDPVFQVATVPSGFVPAAAPPLQPTPISGTAPAEPLGGANP